MGALIRMRVILSILISLLFLQAVSATGYDIKNPLGPEILKERIRASYGFLSKREPALNSAEYAIVDKFLPFLEEDPQFAIEMIEGLTRNNPNLTASFHLTLGNLHFQTGDLESAASQYRIAVDKYPDFLRAWRAIGLLEMHLKDYSAAKKSLGMAARLGDSDPDTFGLIAYAFYVEKDYISALSAYSHALLFEPESEDWIQGKVACLLELKDYSPAKTILESITRKDPENTKHWLVLANLYIAIKEPLKAATVIEFLREKNLSTSEADSRLATIYLGARLPRLAAQLLLEQIEQGSLPGADKLIACLVALNGMGFYTEAEALAQKMESKLETVDDAYRHAFLTYKGESYMRRGLHADAENYFQQATSYDESGGKVLLKRGINQALSGDYKQAIPLLEEAAVHPNVRVKALQTLAQLLMHQGEFRTAVERLQDAIDAGGGESIRSLHETALHAARRQELDRISLRNAQDL